MSVWLIPFQSLYVVDVILSSIQQHGAWTPENPVSAEKRQEAGWDQEIQRPRPEDRGESSTGVHMWRLQGQWQLKQVIFTPQIIFGGSFLPSFNGSLYKFYCFNAFWIKLHALLLNIAQGMNPCLPCIKHILNMGVYRGWMCWEILLSSWNLSLTVKVIHCRYQIRLVSTPTNYQ